MNEPSDRAPSVASATDNAPSLRSATDNTPSVASATDHAPSLPLAITFAELERLLEDMESLQATKVLELARRLRPGLTAEDIRNPHDFPDLNDPDWHYADGILTGVQSVGNAFRALRRDRESALQAPGEIS